VDRRRHPDIEKLTITTRYREQPGDPGEEVVPQFKCPALIHQLEAGKKVD
jgi:hypothetical protein